MVKAKNGKSFPRIFIAVAIICSGYGLIRLGQDIHGAFFPAACSGEIITAASTPQDIENNKKFTQCLELNKGRPIDINLIINASDIGARDPICVDIVDQSDLEDQYFDSQILESLYPMPIDESCATVIVLPDATHWIGPGTGLLHGTLEGTFVPKSRRGGWKGVYTIWSLTAH